MKPRKTSRREFLGAGAATALFTQGLGQFPARELGVGCPGGLGLGHAGTADAGLAPGGHGATTGQGCSLARTLSHRLASRPAGTGT